MPSPLQRDLRRLVAAFTLSFAGSCAAPTQEPAAQSLILITVDTLRADALGFAGNTRVRTPTLDRLAAGGLVFDNAHAHSTVTLPSHANILTGLLPFRHGVRDNLGFTLSPDQLTLAEMLKGEGFATAAFVAAIPLTAETGLDQGFDLYDDRLPSGSPENPFLMEQRRGDEVVEAALEWWNRQADRRRFLWVHLFEPHAPYDPPAALRGEYQGKPYLGEVAAADAYLAPLLDPLLAGAAQGDTIIVFTSDHGESLGEHGEITHGFFAYESTLKVPLVIWGPGITAGRETRAARHVDILPTVLDALELDGDPVTDGRSLIDDQTAEDAWPPTYFESLTANLTRGWAPLRGLIRNGDKAIESPVPELYDLRDDPGEERNLLPRESERYRSLVAQLPDVGTLQADRDPVSSEVERRLQALGYLGGSAPQKSSYGPEDDLKNLIDLDRRLMRTHMLYTRGAYEQAAGVARELLSERPDLVAAQEYLAFSLLHLGRTEESLALMRRARAAGTWRLSLLHQLALTLTRTGRGDEAVAILEELIRDSDQVTSETRNALAISLIGAGRAEEALKVAQEIAAAEPDNAAAFENLALASQFLGRWTDARDYGLRALEIDGDRADAWSNLGVAHVNLGDTEAAMDAWSRAIAIAPAHVDALFNFGITAADLGRADEAGRALERFLEVAPASGYDREIEVARGALRGPSP